MDEQKPQAACPAAIKTSIGGQALLEGIMMRGPKKSALAVRLPDRRSGVTLVRQPPFHYAGGFNPVLVELADALPVQAFTRNYID